jgi:hypothetical protein
MHMQATSTVPAVCGRRSNSTLPDMQSADTQKETEALTPSVAAGMTAEPSASRVWLDKFGETARGHVSWEFACTFAEEFGEILVAHRAASALAAKEETEPVAELIRINEGNGKTVEFACVNVGEKDGYKAPEGVTVLSRESLYLNTQAAAKDETIRKLRQQVEDLDVVIKHAVSCMDRSCKYCNAIQKGARALLDRTAPKGDGQ